MNNKKLNANELPELAGAIKDLVNWGKWNLYEIQCKSNINAKYALSNEEGEYLLDINGKPLTKKKSEEIEYISMCKFDGIPMPPTINMPSYVTIR
jgi:hypothetical protein